MARLLERVAAGDESAVKACVARYGDLVWSLALRLLRDRAEAEDAVQDVFVELWRSAGRYDPSVAAESTFVTLIARRRLYDRLRRASRAAPEVPADALDRLCAPGAQAAMEARPEASLAAKALAQLPEAERKVLLLGTYYGHSHAEIAAELDLPLGTVKTHARRGLLRLRGLLEAPREAAR